MSSKPGPSPGIPEIPVLVLELVGHCGRPSTCLPWSSRLKSIWYLEGGDQPCLVVPCSSPFSSASRMPADFLERGLFPAACRLTSLPPSPSVVWSRCWLRASTWKSACAFGEKRAPIRLRAADGRHLRSLQGRPFGWRSLVCWKCILCSF